MELGRTISYPATNAERTWCSKTMILWLHGEFLLVFNFIDWSNAQQRWCLSVLYVCSICFLFLLPLHIVIIVVVCAYSMQESIRNSADGMLLSPDSLVVYIAKNQGFDGDQQPSSATAASPPRKNRVHSFGIDGLDLLKFTYKVYYVWVHFLLSFNSISWIDFNVYMYWMRQVPWPLELIANAEAVKKYNQVILFTFGWIWGIILFLFSNSSRLM